jgi:thiosulfate dehydrogenase [quinone] large subunit
MALGWVFFYSGVEKLLDPEWSAQGYLTHAIPDGNPFVSLWPLFASTPFIDVLVQWGLALTGLGLIVGAFVRWSALCAGFMMLVFWASSLPLENGFLIDSHVIYLLALFGLAAIGGGRILGVDTYLERLAVVQRYPSLRYVLG